MTFAFLQPLSFVLHAGLATTVTATEQLALSSEQMSSPSAFAGPLAHLPQGTFHREASNRHSMTSRPFAMPVQIRSRGPWGHFKAGLHHLSARVFTTTDTMRFFLKDSYHQAVRRVFPALAGAALLASPTFASQIYFDKMETAGTPVSDHVDLEEFVGVLSTGMRLESNKGKKFSLDAHYADLMRGKGEEALLSRYQRAHIPVKKARLDNDIFQTDDPHRSIVEISANALDASPSDVAITLRDGFYEVLDHGTGMTAEILLTKLLIPKLSDKPDIEKQIGRFGIGFYTALRHLKKNGDQVILETKTAGENAYRLTFTYYAGKIWLKRETFDQASDKNHFLEALGPEKTGTRVQARAKDIKRQAMTKEVSRYLRYVNGPRRLLLNERPVPKIGSEYQAVITVGDVVIEQYRTEGKNLSDQEMLFRLPLATGLSVTRDQIQIDDAITTHFEGVVRGIEDFAELNVLVGLFAAFDKRKPAKNFIAMLRERARELARVQATQDTDLRFYPDNGVADALRDDDNIVFIHPDIYPTELLDRFETPIEFRSGVTQSDSGLKIPITMVLSDDLNVDYHLDKTLGLFYLNRNTYQTRPNFVWSAFFMIPGYDYRIDWGRVPTLGAEKMVAPEAARTVPVEKANPPEKVGPPKKATTISKIETAPQAKPPKNRAGTEKLRSISQALERTGLQLSDLAIPVAHYRPSGTPTYEHEGVMYTVARRDGLEGLINERGQWVLFPPSKDYTSIEDVAFEGSRILAVRALAIATEIPGESENKFQGVVDQFGQWVVPMGDHDIEFIRYRGQIKICVKKTSHPWTNEYLNSDGTRWEIVPQHFHPTDFYLDKDQIFFRDDAPDGSELYNATTQTWLIPPHTDTYVDPFAEDGVQYFRVMGAGRYGLLRADDGKWIFPMEEGDIEYKSILSPDGKTTRRAWFERYNPNEQTRTHYSLEGEILEKFNTKICAIEWALHRNSVYKSRVDLRSGVGSVSDRLRVTVTTPNGTEHTLNGRSVTEPIGESFIIRDKVGNEIIVYAPKDLDLVELARVDVLRPHRIELTSEKDKLMIQNGDTLTVYAANEAGLVEISRFDLTPLDLERFRGKAYTIETNGRDLVVRVDLGKGTVGVIGADGEWLYEPGRDPDQVKIYGGEIFIFPLGDSFNIVLNARGEIIRKTLRWAPMDDSGAVVRLIEDVQIENDEGETYLKLTRGEVLRVVPYGLEPISSGEIGYARTESFYFEGERVYLSSDQDQSWIYNTEGEVLITDTKQLESLPTHPSSHRADLYTSSHFACPLNLSKLAEMASSGRLESRIQDLREARLPLDGQQAALFYAEEKHWQTFLHDRRLHRWLFALAYENVNASLSARPDLTVPEIEARLPLLVAFAKTYSRHYQAEYIDKIDRILTSVDTDKLYADIEIGRDSQEIQAIGIYLRDHAGRSLIPEEARIAIPSGPEHRLADVITKIRSIERPTLSDLSHVPTYNNPEDWRDLVHAVNHLHATHPNIFVREWLQNSLDVLNRHTGEAPQDRRIEMETYLHNNNLAVRFRDYGGMTEEEFLGLLEPGEGSKRGRGELGGFGIGFYSSLASANWVRVRTATRGARVVIEAEFRVERNPQGKITDIRYRFHRRTNTDEFYGTEIESERFGMVPDFEAARLQTTFTDMSKYVSASAAQTRFNGEQTNAGRNGPLVTMTDELLGRVELLDGLDNRILLGRLPVTELPETLWQEIPPQIREYYQRLGFYLNLDHTVVHPTPTRDRFRDQGRVMERLKTILPGLLLQGFLQRVVSQDHPEDLQSLPREYFIEAYASMARETGLDPELVRIERDARAIDEGRFENVRFAFYSHGESGERRLLKLLTRLHFMAVQFETDVEHVSLHEIYETYQRARRGDTTAEGRLRKIKDSVSVPDSIRGKLVLAQVANECAQQTRQTLSTARAPYLNTKLKEGKEYKTDRFTDPAYQTYLRMLQRVAEHIFRHHVPEGQVVTGMHTIFDIDMIPFARHYRRGNTYYFYRTFGDFFDRDVARLKTILERLAANPADAEANEAYGRFLAEMYEVVSHELTHVLTERPDTPDFTHDAVFYRDNGTILIEGTRHVPDAAGHSELTR